MPDQPLIRCPICNRLKTSSLKRNPKAPPFTTDWLLAPGCFNPKPGITVVAEVCSDCAARQHAVIE